MLLSKIKLEYLSPKQASDKATFNRPLLPPKTPTLDGPIRGRTDLSALLENSETVSHLLFEFDALT